jgi:hypothetical protein
MAALVAISVILGVWGSFSGSGGAAGPGGSGPDGNGTNPTPTSTALTTPVPAVSAADALAPFFSADGADTVLLVASTMSLTDTESDWLEDIRMEIGPAETLSYAAVTSESLAKYLTIFVIDDSGELDVTALAQSAAAGATVHLIGDAAAYSAQVIPGGAG